MAFPATFFRLLLKIHDLSVICNSVNLLSKMFFFIVSFMDDGHFFPFILMQFPSFVQLTATPGDWELLNLVSPCHKIHIDP